MYEKDCQTLHSRHLPHQPLAQNKSSLEHLILYEKPPLQAMLFLVFLQILLKRFFVHRGFQENEAYAKKYLSNLPVQELFHLLNVLVVQYFVMYHKAVLYHTNNPSYLYEYNLDKPSDYKSLQVKKILDFSFL